MSERVEWAEDKSTTIGVVPAETEIGEHWTDLPSLVFSADTVFVLQCHHPKAVAKILRQMADELDKE